MLLSTFSSNNASTITSPPCTPSGSSACAASNKKVGMYAPSFVRNVNITLSYGLLLQYRDLYSWGLTCEIRETLLLRKAERLYQDYLNMKDDKQPGEEYDLIEWWS
ncbi:MAG: hypothetical protein H6556_13660 [Lewinellaceae bacterium]|nr:hypothetical protein [Lewinellaceae bacterium]